MSSTIINPNAAVTIGLEGLAICCFNQEFNNNRGRWEVAFPRFGDHDLIIRIDGLGTILVDQAVKFIEIKDRTGVTAKPKHEVGGTFDRKKNDNDKNDFRWLVDFTNNSDLPHGNVSVITKADNPDRAGVTMLHIHDATFYTKTLVRDSIIRAEQANTAPVVNGSFRMLQNIVGQNLDGADDFGLETKTMGIDIESAEGSSIDIMFDGVTTTTIPRGAAAREIKIENLEPRTIPSNGRFVQTADFEYGLGDLFRYYELFRVEGPKFHLWGRRSLVSASASNRTTDCGPVRLNLDNLGGLL